MSEFDRAPLIRLQIDQEIFQDAVQDGDEIDDATVATEVTSFERVGDAYVLEGAIVFAGYINRASSVSEDTESQAPAGIGHAETPQWGQSANGSALHNRLPFVLRVPVKSQPRGIVNVASRISAWQLQTVSSGWIRVVADLSIVGLSGAHGYHFECGSQEYGDVLLGQSEPHQPPETVNRTEAPDVSDTGEAESSDYTVNAHADENARELDLQLMRGSDDADVRDAAGTSEDDDSLAAAETISQARGGAEGNTTESMRHKADDNDTAKRELAHLDRAFGGVVHDQPETTGDKETSPPVRGEKSNVVEFDFEHQVSPQELRDALLHEEPVGDSAKGEFRARGASEDGESAELTEPVEETADEGTNVIMRGSAAEDDGEGNVISSELWSFVDFNSPEQSYTMRYVIVSEEENLESIADRVGVLKSDLLRANQISEEVVHPGQALAVPGRPVIPLDV